MTSVTTAVRNAVVTGANRGIGLEICRQLANASPPADYTSIYALCRKSNSDLESLRDRHSKIVIVENVELVGNEESLSTVIENTFASKSDNPLPIALCIHNSGAYGPPEDIPKDDSESLYVSQTLDAITSKRMLYAYELNTVAPLYLTKLLMPNLLQASQTMDGRSKENTVKTIIISSVMGSIHENTSGGHYAYRASKAAVNMVAKSLSVDLKEKNIAVGTIHPGYVFTGFNGMNTSKISGQREVDESARGVIEAIDSIGMDNTGSFLHGNYGEGVKPLPW